MAEAYIAGLEDRVKKGLDMSKLASVASFFVSRIDSLVDTTIQNKLKTETDSRKKELLIPYWARLRLPCRQAYRTYEKIVAGARWQALVARGAQSQRLLWASTSTKNPSYRRALHRRAHRAGHGQHHPAGHHGCLPRSRQGSATIDHDLPGADKTMSDLETAGISMQQITTNLLDETIRLFVEAFDKLLPSSLKKKIAPRQME